MTSFTAAAAASPLPISDAHTQEHMQLLKLEAAMWDSTQVAQRSFPAWWRRLLAVLLLTGAAGAVWAFRPKAQAPSATPTTEVWALATSH